jgi:hypothetical protein
MQTRNITDREHVEALIRASEALLQAGTVSPAEMLYLKVRLAKAASRARTDLNL